MADPFFRGWRLRWLAAAILVVALSGCGGAGREAPASPVQGAAARPDAPESDPGGGSAGAAEAEPEAKPFPGYRAPEIIARDVYTGDTLQLSALRGQVVMVNFWATWCPPCREEMPAMEQFHQASQGKVRVLAVAADGGEPPERLAAFARELGLSFPVVHDGGEAALTYRAFGLPTSLFIDQHGIIRVRFSGPLTREQMESFAVETARLAEAAEAIEVEGTEG